MNKIVRTGDIFICNFGNHKGSLQQGVRPCVIVDNNMACMYSPCVHCVPLSSKMKNMPLHYGLNNKTYVCLERNSMALCEQYTLIDKAQLGEKIGVLNRGDLANITDLCKLNLPFTYK